MHFCFLLFPFFAAISTIKFLLVSILSSYFLQKIYKNLVCVWSRAEIKVVVGVGGEEKKLCRPTFSRCSDQPTKHTPPFSLNYSHSRNSSSVIFPSHHTEKFHFLAHFIIYMLCRSCSTCTFIHTVHIFKIIFAHVCVWECKLSLTLCSMCSPSKTFKVLCTLLFDFPIIFYKVLVLQ